MRSPCDIASLSVASLRIGRSLGKLSGNAALFASALFASAFFVSALFVSAFFVSALFVSALFGVARSAPLKDFSLLLQPDESAARIISATTAWSFTIDRRLPFPAMGP